MNQNALVVKIESELQIKIVDTSIPPQGMTSKVFFVKDSNNNEYAIKYGKSAANDVPALQLIKDSGIQIPIPKFYKTFSFEDEQILVLEKISFPLLESTSNEEMAKYIPSMINNLKILHTIKSEQSGLLIDHTKKQWKDILLSIFNGDDFDWNEIASREGLNKNLVLESVNYILEIINSLEFDYKDYSLLHTDFNQRNLFINPNSFEITGIIDWEETMYGDPIFDFARIRMLIWHFNLGKNAENEYYKLMNYTKKERELDDLYWLIRIIQYLAWYSENLNEFNLSRIKLHQNYLENINS